MIPGLGLPIGPADDDNTPYSPGSSPEPPPVAAQKPAMDVGLSEKLARLQAEVAAKREELAQREQQLRPYMGPGVSPHDQNR